MHYKFLFLFLPVVLFQPLCAQVKVSDNGRFLVANDGKPFFWLGDTNWELFHRLTREEVLLFLDKRKEQGFNVIQAVALAEMDGLRTPNRYGDWPLNNENPAQLLTTPGNDPKNDYQYDYWDHVDFVIDEAAKRGLYIGLLPTWGDKVAHLWGEGPIVFNEQNAETYARTLAGRYASRWNILWIIGGDRPTVYKSSREGSEKQYDDRPVWRAMAKGIGEALGKAAFISYHPSGGESNSTSYHLHNESWLDMNAFQTGHGARETKVWEWVARDLALTPPKPTLDMEPCYEDHPVNPWDGKWTRKGRGYFDAYDVRARMYRGVFAGACGTTYGHHQIWQFLNTELYAPVNVGDTLIGWQKALDSEGAGQMQHLKNLMLSRPYFSRVPDQGLIRSDAGSTYVDYITATRDAEGSYALIYLPQNRPVTIALEKLSGARKKVWWFDPRTGRATPGKEQKGKKPVTLAPPEGGKDWVLVIDDASRNFNAPGIL
ncbi:MAG: hypothetical protein ABS46_13430 [Cytophagaceae bacterium SCN 52-12]|nr:MAG: hypothetical protein ABS46_13430 [Cytophagaceae bacterium SCN 52-12]